MSSLSAHLLRQVKREPRLAWLIGPGSETWNLLMAEAGITGADRDTLQQALTYQSWPTDLIREAEELLNSNDLAGYDSRQRANFVEALKAAGGRVA